MAQAQNLPVLCNQNRIVPDQTRFDLFEIDVLAKESVEVSLFNEKIATSIHSLRPALGTYVLEIVKWQTSLVRTCAGRIYVAVESDDEVNATGRTYMVLHFVGANQQVDFARVKLANDFLLLKTIVAVVGLVVRLLGRFFIIASLGFCRRAAITRSDHVVGINKA